MIIDFSQQSESELKFTHSYAPGNLELDDETAEITGAVDVSGTAKRGAEILSVNGELTAALKIACSRCAQLVDYNLKTSFETEFVTLETYQQTSTDHQIGAADFALSVYDGERVDLDEIVREQILLNLPMSQLCREDCRGLCEKCGANKNTNDCSCENEVIDSRWNALRELKSKN